MLDHPDSTPVLAAWTGLNGLLSPSVSQPNSKHVRYSDNDLRYLCQHCTEL
jgi:hypothetical protein